MYNVCIYLIGGSFNFQCSFRPQCTQSSAKNELLVSNFLEKYGHFNRSKGFDCFYNPHNISDVIQHRRYTLGHVIHSVLWTSVMLTISVGFLVYVVRHRHCGFFLIEDS